MSACRGSSSDKELWDRVSAVLRGKAELQPSEGLNFDQFLDCLAR